MSFRRMRGDRGSGVVVMITLLFAFTFLGLVWLARDVDRSVSNRSAAQSIAFQSARAGAQATDVAALRRGEEPRVDPGAAAIAVARTADALFASYGLDGRVVAVEIGTDRVSVTVQVDDAGRIVSGQGTARAERVP